MIMMSDYKDDKGNYDWKAYDEARIRAGEKCYTCGGCIILPPYYGRQQCDECQEIYKSRSELRHSKFIRCPKCMGTFDGFEALSRAEEGEHRVKCWDCNHDFEVTLRIEYTFVSPAGIAKEVPSEEDDE